MTTSDGDRSLFTGKDELFLELLRLGATFIPRDGFSVDFRLKQGNIVTVTWGFFFLAGCFGLPVDWFPRTVYLYSWRDIFFYAVS